MPLTHHFCLLWSLECIFRKSHLYFFFRDPSASNEHQVKQDALAQVLSARSGYKSATTKTIQEATPLSTVQGFFFISPFLDSRTTTQTNAGSLIDPHAGGRKWRHDCSSILLVARVLQIFFSPTRWEKVAFLPVSFFSVVRSPTFPVWLAMHASLSPSSPPLTTRLHNYNLHVPQKSGKKERNCTGRTHKSSPSH